MKSSAVLLCLVFHSVCSLFDQCNHKFHMKRGEKIFINSPYYPYEYPIGTSCRYMVTAPEDYGLKFKCDIKLNTPSTLTSCVNEIFYFNREGSELTAGSEYFCHQDVIERTSFLNQAVISYISTPQNKRTLINSWEEGTNDIEAEAEAETRNVTTSTTTTTSTTQQPLKVEQEQLKPTTTTTTTTIASTGIALEVPKPITTLSTLSVMTSLTPSLTVVEDKNVSNSFAYVVALLSNNKLNLEAFGTPPPPLPLPLPPVEPGSSLPALFTGVTSRPTSVFNFRDFLPASTWRNGSNGIHKISHKREPKVIVGQDYTSPATVATAQTTQSPHWPLLRSGEGGGSFSCLVEVTEPSCACGWSATSKIVEASGVAGINEFPSMAGVMSTKTQRIFCGAAIIHHRYLLSAAHCYITPDTNRPELLRIVVGEHDVSTVLESFYTRYYDISKIIVHEQFRSTASRVHNDIALLKTRIPIVWNRSVGPACLPFLPTFAYDGSRKPPYTGQLVETAGWGTTSFGGQQSSVLLKTTLDVISREQCQNIIQYLPTGAFCTYTQGRDTCQYDSGGALYLRGERLYAVGIVSYGYACATNQPSVNTRVASHLKWIRNKTPEVQYCVK